MNKTAEDENFPVGKLIKKSLRPLVAAYYEAARLADDIADNPELDTATKLNDLEQIAAAFAGQNDEPAWVTARTLGQLFVAEKLDSRLFTDLLVAFQRDATNQQPQIWEQLVDYCNYSAVPVGRFMLAIHNESPSTYLPAASLCTALQLVNHLQDLKTDAVTLNRIYLPAEMLTAAGAVNGDLYLTSMTAPLREVVTQIVHHIRGQLQDARLLPSIVQSFRLRAELGVIFSLTNSMLKRIERGDMLRHRPTLSKLDWLRAMIAGARTAIFKS